MCQGLYLDLGMKINMRRYLVLVVLLAEIAPGDRVASGNRVKTKGSIEEFGLNTKCLGVILVVEHLSDDARKTGLRRKEIIAAVEARLRAAGLYQSGYFGFPEVSAVFLPHQYVDVNVKGDEFSVLAGKSHRRRIQ